MSDQRRRQTRPRHNLAPQPVELLGRQFELEAAQRQLTAADPPVRLLTLTGPGGTGKTRLAVEVARTLVPSFDDGVFFVDLAPVREASFITSVVARAVGLDVQNDQPIAEQLRRFLSDKHMLLVLDNLEQIGGAALHIAALLTDCPEVSILATSRSKIGVRWEHVLPVPPLQVPDARLSMDIDLLGEVPAVRLIVQRASALDPTFALTAQNAPSIAELCVRLDGLPLALELAAARLDVLPAQMILHRLIEQPLAELRATAEDRPSRHMTLRRAIAWSYDLLDDREQALFRRVAVFEAGFTLAAARAVRTLDGAGDDDGAQMDLLEGLTSLVTKSLLRCEPGMAVEPRFRMLETIRAFALEELRDDELEATATRCCDFFVTLAEEAELQLTGADAAGWLEGLEQELDNVRACLRWCVGRRDAVRGLRLASALWRFWFISHHLSEGSDWLEQCLQLPGADDVAPTLLATAWNAAGNLAHARGKLHHAADLHRASLALRESSGDRHSIAISLNSLANVAVEQGDYVAARDLHEASLRLRRELGDPRSIAIALNNLAVIARDQEEWRRAAELSRESAELFEQLGDRQGVALSFVTLGAAEHHLGAAETPVSLLEQSLAIFRESDNHRELAECFQVMATLAHTRGQSVVAARLFGTAERMLEQMGSSMLPSRSPRYRRTLDEVCQHLGEEQFAAARAHGRATEVDDAVVWAIESQQRELSPPRANGSQPEHRTSVERTSATLKPMVCLTRREQEVVALVARGLTNRQIADELIIAERTAESHVCNALAKLGLRSRVQLTAWVLGGELVPHPAA